MVSFVPALSTQLTVVPMVTGVQTGGVLGLKAA
jgi:hypothetical protein